jgi:hypothetical protein
MNRLAREPLVHFLVLAAIVFAAYAVINRSGEMEEPQRITVTPAKIEQISGLFAKTWQRPPTPAELKGLIDDFVKEEMYVREALALGLDQDDTVIRRRLRLKMEFMSDAEAGATPPTDAELQAWLDAHPDEFRNPSEVAFEQVFLNPQTRGAAAAADAGALLAALRGPGGLDATTAGDPTLLPFALPLSSAAQVAGTFGADFVEALEALPDGQWSGPVASGYGLHLVRVTQRKAGAMPTLEEARAAVEREWMNARRQDVESRRLEELLKKYEVVIEPPATSGAP